MAGECLKTKIRPGFSPIYIVRKGEIMAKGKNQNDITRLSFEQAIKQLNDIVGQIEQGKIPLQDSLQQYEKGMALIKHCRRILQKAEKRIEKITEEDSESGGQNTDDRRQDTDDGGQNTDDGGQDTDDGGQDTDDG